VLRSRRMQQAFVSMRIVLQDLEIHLRKPSRLRSFSLRFRNLTALPSSHSTLTPILIVVQRCINEEARQQLSYASRSSKQPSGQNSAFSTDSKPRRDKKGATCYRFQKKGHCRNECKGALEERSKATAVAASVTDSESVTEHRASRCVDGQGRGVSGVEIMLETSCMASCKNLR
jgi:hypothetical protein